MQICLVHIMLNFRLTNQTLIFNTFTLMVYLWEQNLEIALDKRRFRISFAVESKPLNMTFLSAVTRDIENKFFAFVLLNA